MQRVVTQDLRDGDVMDHTSCYWGFIVSKVERVRPHVWVDFWRSTGPPVHVRLHVGRELGVYRELLLAPGPAAGDGPVGVWLLRA